MRIGIGGGLGPFRGGLSNKGFGVGVGPISVGGSWKRGRRASSDGTSFFYGLVFLAAAWPWFVTYYKTDGLPEGSRVALAWVAESAWLVLCAAVLVARVVRARDKFDAFEEGEHLMWHDRKFRYGDNEYRALLDFYVTQLEQPPEISHAASIGQRLVAERDLSLSDQRQLLTILANGMDRLAADIVNQASSGGDGSALTQQTLLLRKATAGLREQIRYLSTGLDA